MRGWGKPQDGFLSGSAPSWFINRRFAERVIPKESRSLQEFSLTTHKAELNHRLGWVDRFDSRALHRGGPLLHSLYHVWSAQLQAERPIDMGSLSTNQSLKNHSRVHTLTLSSSVNKTLGKGRAKSPCSRHARAWHPKVRQLGFLLVPWTVEVFEQKANARPL